MKQRAAVLAMVKNEGIFMPFWINHYSKYFDACDMYVHSDGSVDNTEELVRAAGVNFIAVANGTIQVGKNDRYVKNVISMMLEKYECVLFAESPDDIIVPGEENDCDLRKYIDSFLSDNDRYRFLSGINIVQHIAEKPYDSNLGTLLSQREYAIRCPQYDNPFLWKDVPLWGRGWHDLGGKRLVGYGDLQEQRKQLFNLHIHYADFDLCNQRHKIRQATFTPEQKLAYACATGEDLSEFMMTMIVHPMRMFSDGKIIPVQDWMRKVI